MRLYCSLTSPYARKARATIIEKGLQQAVELVVVDPLADAALRTHNPLGKVPALALSDGRTLVDSPVICAWLDELGSGPTLIPSQRDAGFDALHRAALADGVLDAAVSIVIERRRPAAQQSEYWTARWTQAIAETLALFEHAPPPPRAQPDLGDLGLAIAVEYLQFRLPDLGFAAGAPSLAQWAATLAERPSLRETRPPG